MKSGMIPLSNPDSLPFAALPDAGLTVLDDQGPGAGRSRRLAGLRAGEVGRSADPGGDGGPLGGEETGWLGAVLKRSHQMFSRSAADAAVITRGSANHER